MQDVHSINELPNEVLYMIFCYLPCVKLYGISRVSRLWYYLAKCIKIYPIIYFFDNESMNTINWHNKQFQKLFYLNNLRRNCLTLDNNVFIVSRWKRMSDNYGSNYKKNIIQILDLTSNQTTTINFNKGYIENIYVSKDRTRFAIMHFSYGYMDNHLIIYNSLTKDMIERKNIKSTWIYPLSQVTDKIIFVDISKEAIYPIYYLNMKTCQMINIRISIDIPYYFNKHNFEYKLSIDENKLFIRLDRKMILIDITTIDSDIISCSSPYYHYEYKPLQIAFLSITTEINQFRISEDGKFIAIKSICGKIDIWNTETLNQVIIPELHAEYDEKINLEEYVSNIVKEFIKLKDINSFPWNNDWFYISLFFPQCIMSSLFFVTYTNTDLVVVNKHTYQIIASFIHKEFHRIICEDSECNRYYNT